MKAIIEFDLPDDQDEFKRAVQGYEYYRALWEIKEWVRKQEQYPDLYNIIRQFMPEDMD